MADKEIAMLPATDGVIDDTIIPVYQPGALDPAQKMTGAQFRAFAQDAVQPQVEAAEAAAKEAEETAKSINLEPVYEELSIKGDNLEVDPDTGLLYLTAYGNRVSSGIKIETSDGGNVTALSYIYEILRRGVFTEDVSFIMAALKQAIESGGSGGDEPEDGPIVGTRYYIKQNLTNVTSSNSTISVSEGASYTTILSAADGYNLSTVSVTMGGVDVTDKVYSNGVISISSVTGNIEITAVAKGVVVEDLTPIFGATTYPDKNTYETTPKDMSSGSAATVYAQSVLFEGASISGGVLHIELDTTKLTFCRARIYLVDSEGNPYKHNQSLGVTEAVSGDITDSVAWYDAETATSVGIIYMNGSISCEIPEGYVIKWVYIDGIQVANIVDTELSAAAKPIYATIDAICFDGEVITAKVVKEV